MNFELSDDQRLMQATFARFLDRNSSMESVRRTLPGGFDPQLWKGLADLGAFSIRVPEQAGGAGLGCFEAAILLEECGRTLASGPVAEAILATRLIALLEPQREEDLLAHAIRGERLVTLAYHDAAKVPVQTVAGGQAADFVVARIGDKVVLFDVHEAAKRTDDNLGSTAPAEIALAGHPHVILGEGEQVITLFSQAIEEWKLLMAAALLGLSREAIRLAAAYATERCQFGQPIGAFQAISHPLADRITDVEGGRAFLWRTMYDIAAKRPQAGAEISLAAWWSIVTAGRTGYQAVHSFGGYGLATEYDIHLYNLRAKAWPLVFGDPAGLLEEAGRRLYAGEIADLPAVGELAIEFRFDAEAEGFAAEVDAFFRQHLTPEIRASREAVENQFDPVLHKQLAAAGLLFPAWPKEHGGRGASPLAVNAAQAVWGAHDWKPGPVGVTTMVATIIQKFGSDVAKREILPKLLSGDAICSLGFSEPGSGSDVFAAQCRSVRDGDDWRIDGAKMWTSRAHIADYVLLLTRSDASGRKHEGLTMFVLPLKSEGVSIQPVHTFIDERTNATFYDAVRVPDAYRLGEAGRGAQVMAASLSLEHSGASFHHDQRRMLEAAEEICRSMLRGGCPIIDQTNAQVRLARVFAKVEITGMLWLLAVWWSASGKPDRCYGSMVKLFSAEAFVSDSADMLDLTAPYSLYRHEVACLQVNLSYRHAHGTSVYGGTSEIHRSRIAEQNLGLPRTRR